MNEKGKGRRRESMVFDKNCLLLRSILVFGFTLLACGCGSQSSETTDVVERPGNADVVEPPGQNAALDVEAEEPSPPGGLELPPGEIPPATDDAKPADAGGIEMPKGVAVPEADGAAVSPSIQYGSWEEVYTLAKSTGRVTVVDLWSLSCEPCLREFPGLVRLHQSMGSKVQCMAVDLDFDGRKSRPPEYYEDQVVDFLKSVKASGFPMFISTTPSDDVFAAAKLSSIPAVLIFDAEGELAKAFVDAGETLGFTYDKDVIPLVAKLAP